MVELIYYIAIFLSGTVFGSFFTLAVYRIPRKENITYVRSHCTSCDHTLGFWDLIPVLSYIFLGGKCRYCGEKIRIRYLLLEILSGIVFLLVALTHGLSNLIYLVFVYLFFAGMFIIAGIDKEKYLIPNSLCIYELLIAIAFIGYRLFMKLSIMDHLYGMFLIPVILLILDLLFFVLLKNKEKKFLIGFGDLKYLALIGLMFGFKIQVIAIVISLILSAIGILIHRYKEIPWGFYLTIATIMVVIYEPYLVMLLEII